jgi:hypothetical protein
MYEREKSISVFWTLYRKIRPKNLPIGYAGIPGNLGGYFAKIHENYVPYNAL